jgi:hypothetical protein
MGLTLTVLCVTVGCPQLKDDDFGPLLVDGGTGGFAGGAGTAGCDGLGGCGAAASAGTAGVGTGGSAGSPNPPRPDGGTPALGECGPDAVTAPNGVCYFIDSTTRTWAEARASCQARGALWDLVAIHDAERNTFVLPITGFEAWIGATDIVDEGAWVWVDEDTPFFEVGAATNTDYAPWADGEPNDYDDSDCLRILTTGEWADWPCDSLLGHICRLNTIP